KARNAFDRAADELFFSCLWQRFDAEVSNDLEQIERVEQDFIRQLHAVAQKLFKTHIPTIPCLSIYRPRAEARAKRQFQFQFYKTFPFLK
ncbi:MAG: hypothetical protein HQL68_08245, partial [Magnetococcales bacterium]|nr:hypothetical protein [Magnetococcales bacterium]